MTSLSFQGEKEFQISSVSEVTELWNLDQTLFQKINFFFNLKLNGRKLGFNTPLSSPKFC